MASKTLMMYVWTLVTVPNSIPLQCERQVPNSDPSRDVSSVERTRKACRAHCMPSDGTVPSRLVFRYHEFVLESLEQEARNERSKHRHVMLCRHPIAKQRSERPRRLRRRKEIRTDSEPSAMQYLYNEHRLECTGGFYCFRNKSRRATAEHLLTG